METCNIRAIDLTKELKDELILILNANWPAYKFWFSGESNHFIFYRRMETSSEINIIHWFEFLVKAICDLEVKALEQFYFKIIE